MAAIKIPPPDPKKDKITSISSFLAIAGDWQKEQAKLSGDDDDYLGQLWYRGVNQQFDTQVPGVYRPQFTERAQAKYTYSDIESRRLRLERDMLGDFRSGGAAFLGDAGLVDLYFRAQHVGMPTRLLDWSTNPLAALFFACEGAPGEDGAVYAMVAKKIIPPNTKRTNVETLHRAVMSMRHPFVHYAVALSFWNDPKDDHHPHILPIRPDTVPGRIGQQSSVFTLHMHKAPDVINDTMVTLVVDAKSKDTLRDELHRVHINQFTTYYDLDHLAKEIKRCFRVNM